MFSISETIILIAVITIIMLFIFYLIIVKPMRRLLKEQSIVLHMLLKENKRCGELLHDVSNLDTSIKEDVTSLSTSIGLFMQDVNKRYSEKIYPTPDLSKMIESTIKEQIAIEVALSKDMALPRKDSVNRIIETVSNTYPHVNVEYITRKCLSIMETAIK